MNPDWLSLVDGLFLFTLFAAAPLLMGLVGYATYRGWPKGFDRRRFMTWFAITLLTAVGLLVLAKMLNADVRTPLFLVQGACFEAGAILFGVAGGFMIGIFVYQWGISARLHDGDAKPSGTSRLRAVYWVLIILGVNLANVALMSRMQPAGREGLDTFSSIVLAVQFIAVGGSYWMLADWFIKKGQRRFKKWMWLFFVPWGWLWYQFEVRPFIRPTEAETM